MTGKMYEIVPPGIHGQVDIISTSSNAVPANATLPIIKTVQNYPPAYKPSYLPQSNKEKKEGEENDEEEEDFL